MSDCAPSNNGEKMSNDEDKMITVLLQSGPNTYTMCYLSAQSPKPEQGEMSNEEYDDVLYEWEEEDPSVKTFSHYESNDEGGGTRTNYTYQLIDDKIVCEVNQASRDCDGATSSSTMSHVEVKNLIPNTLPVWETLERSQRDYAAEAAGY